MGRRGSSITDVARAAGVSYQTVSRVLNSQPGVASATVRRVRDAMRELDYRPSAVARSLVTGSSRTIGVISFGTSLFGPIRTLQCVEQSVLRADYHVSSVHLPRMDHDSYADAVERLVDNGVDGILVVEPESADERSLVAPTSAVPIALVGGLLEKDGAAQTAEYGLGCRRAVRHLLDLGHETVWHVAGPRNWAAAREREHGWRAELEAAEVEPPEPVVGDWYPGSGYRAGRILAANPDITAIFVANDDMAVGVLLALHEAGRRVPNDVSLVGYDDRPEAAYLIPPLTTLRQNFEDDAERSVGMLLDQLEGRSAQRRPTVVVPELILRASTAPPG